MSVCCHRFISTNYCSPRHLSNVFANSVLQFLAASPLKHTVTGLVRVVLCLHRHDRH